MTRRLIGPPHAHQDAPCTDDCYEEVPDMKKYSLVKNGRPVETFSMLDDEDLSDGYHTFGELYDHRRALTAALAAERADISWRSKAHHPDDSPMFEGGYFIVMAVTPVGQISYHYTLKHWDKFQIPEVERTPPYDGHSSLDVLARLEQL